MPMATSCALSPQEAAALACITGTRDAMLADIIGWAGINSGSGNRAGLAAMNDQLAAAFAPLGGTITRLPPADAAAQGDNIHICRRPDARLRVLLTGHMDTVFAADHPFQHCRWRDADTLNGPGVADMKGGIAVMKTALMALEASPFAAAIGWDVVLNCDEEIGSPGSAPLLAQTAARCHLGLTFEPALPDGTLAGARPGSGNFAAHVTGRAAHAGRNPRDGRNAVLAAADLALWLAALGDDALSVNPARIDGGGPTNIVPDAAVLRWNMRPRDAAAQARARAGIDAAVAAVAAAHDVLICVHGSFTRPPKPLDAQQRRLFDLVKACGTALGLNLGWRDTGGVCDGNNLAATGLAVVDTMGVRGGAIHSSNEFLCADSLEERARLAALVLMRVAQTGWVR